MKQCQIPKKEKKKGKRKRKTGREGGSRVPKQLPARDRLTERVIEILSLLRSEVFVINRNPKKNPFLSVSKE